MIIKYNCDSILRMPLDNCSKEFAQISEAEYLNQKSEQMGEDCFDVLYKIERAYTKH